MRIATLIAKLARAMTGRRHAPSPAPAGQISYAQHGEDLIILAALADLGVERPYYLDVGSNDPVSLSNTFLLYQKGGRGLCIDPNPDCCARFRQMRPRDQVLCAGVGAKEEAARDFYVIDPPVLSTFSKEQAETAAAGGAYRIVATTRVPTITLNQVIERHCEKTPELLSLDTEGLDFELLLSLDFGRYRPAVICVETLAFTDNGRGAKDETIDALLRDNGYFLYGDSHLNSIFVDVERWEHLESRRDH